MGSESSSGQERRQGTQKLVDNLLHERQQMWLLYEQLAGVDPYKSTAKPESLKSFVEILVDYIAAAHFGLYERIVNGKERRQGVVKVAKSLYPKIASSTDAAVAFNDKYEDKSFEEIPEELSRYLSTLGENLALRIELEDKLIAEMVS